MLIKAGTYRFNDVLTEAEFNQDIDFTVGGIADGISFSAYCSNMKGGVKSFADGTTAWVFSVFEDKYIEDGVETVLGIEVDMYNDTTGWLSSPTEGFVHTITEDTEVSEDFGSWYKANTKPLNAETVKIENVIIVTQDGGRLSLNEIYDGSLGTLNYIVVGTTPTDNILISEHNVVNMYYICDRNCIGTYDGEVWTYNNVTLIESEDEAVDIGSGVVYVVVTYSETEKKFTRLYLGEVAHSSNGKRFRKLQTEEYVEPELPEEEPTVDDPYGVIGTWTIRSDADYTTLPFNNGRFLKCFGKFNVHSAISNTVATVNLIEFLFYINNGVRCIELINYHHQTGSITDRGSAKTYLNKGIKDSTQREFYTVYYEEGWNTTTPADTSYYFDPTNTTYMTFTISKITDPTDTDWELYSTWLKANAIRASKGLAFTSNGDGTCYVSGIGTCTDTDIIIPSVSPEGDVVTRIGLYAFDNCSQLTNVKIPDSVTSIGSSAFYSCDSLQSLVIPDSVTSVGGDFLASCDLLTSVTLGNSVTFDGNSSFAYCKNLTTINIPDSVTCIRAFTFSHCEALPSIVIPSGVTEIRNYGLAFCYALNNITFNGTVAQWNAIALGENWNSKVPATYVQCTDGQVAL